MVISPPSLRSFMYFRSRAPSGRKLGDGQVQEPAQVGPLVGFRAEGAHADDGLLGAMVPLLPPTGAGSIEAR